jgi:hypothetical protein
MGGIGGLTQIDSGYKKTGVSPGSFFYFAATGEIVKL